MIVDLHMHSKYSRACSKTLDFPHRQAWAKLKGIDVLAVADFTHPAWFKEIHEKLEEVETGIYALKSEFTKQDNVNVPASCERPARFILSTEISLIYKKNGRVRKVHHVILAPNIETVAKINLALEARGNIKSDGRPILGLDSKELLKILLHISPEIELIPAHIWTPHFAIFGSQSGFDSVEECFDELSYHIHALETGLSSDPAMNWRLSQLDKYVLISSSDAHSPAKMGREATIFNTICSYPAMLRALRYEHSKIAGTIEFFPEEGKYHADGIRDENLCLSPEETKKNNYISTKTGRKITVGVLHRVNSLADKPIGRMPETARPYFSIIPLAEIVAEIIGVGTSSKKVTERYFYLLEQLGPEFNILKDVPISDIKTVDPILAEAISRMRAGKVILQPGYDGIYGVIKLFQPEELKKKAQMVMF